jgi:arsenite oxidase large subunit
MNLTSMNGERRHAAWTERYMDPPGQSKPDCLIAARLASNMERVLRDMGDAAYADQFKGYDWQTEEDAFMDGYHLQVAGGGEHVTYDRVCARPATTASRSRRRAIRRTARSIGTKRLYTDGKFSHRGRQGDASWMRPNGADLQAPGKQEQKDEVQVPDQQRARQRRSGRIRLSSTRKTTSSWIRWPYPYIQMNPEDMAELGRQAQAISSRSTTTPAPPRPWPTPRRRRKARSRPSCCSASPPASRATSSTPGTNELVILPNYKQTWGDIRKIADAPRNVAHLTFKSKEYQSA